jgi:hypothetical protein
VEAQKIKVKKGGLKERLGWREEQDSVGVCTAECRHPLLSLVPYYTLSIPC